MRTEKMSIEERKKFLSGILKEVKVKTSSPQTHTLEIVFETPMVGDVLEWNVKGKPKKGYKVIDGETSTVVEMDSSDKRKRSSKKDTK